MSYICVSTCRMVSWGDAVVCARIIHSRIHMREIPVPFRERQDPSCDNFCSFTLWCGGAGIAQNCYCAGSLQPFQECSPLIGRHPWVTTLVFVFANVPHQCQPQWICRIGLIDIEACGMHESCIRDPDFIAGSEVSFEACDIWRCVMSALVLFNNIPYRIESTLPFELEIFPLLSGDFRLLSWFETIGLYPGVFDTSTGSVALKSSGLLYCGMEPNPASLKCDHGKA